MLFIPVISTYNSIQNALKKIHHKRNCSSKFFIQFVILVSCLIFDWSIKVQAQTPYFQQRLEYTIQLSLDDQNHALSAFLKLKYVNNSPDLLDKIGFHLWPNAYKNQKTEFAIQKIRQGDLKFYHAKSSETGYIDSLQFKVNGLNAVLDQTNLPEDMAWLQLPEVLHPGDSVLIETPFYVKIPTTVSRMGHIGQTYQISQWYPKPAVYDCKGWHLMPYLDQGEFYSEFAQFNVQITLPQNYIVAATGTLETANEREYINQRIQFTKDVLSNKTEADSLFLAESAGQFKTIQFAAKDVHDFAWFADKSFLIQQDTVQLTNVRSVLCQSYFTSPDLWDESIHSVKKSIRFYSEQLGPYPYPQASAVESSLGVGGGMEYPMITVIGPSYSKTYLDEVIAHEVGHNWLYGILASNEREHPFMDEGINTFYENQYVRGADVPSTYVELTGPLKKITGNTNFKQLQYQLFAKQAIDQYPNKHSKMFSELNYGLDVYYKTAWFFEYVEKYLGKTTFKEIMQSYYETWKFKHPYPEDLHNIFHQKTSSNFSWLFDDLLSSERKCDYGLSKIKTKGDSVSVTICNRKSIDAPIQIGMIKNDSAVYVKWIDGFKGLKTIHLPKIPFDYISLDPDHISFDLNDYNNYIKPKGIFKKTEALKCHLFPLIDQNHQTDIGLTPCLGYNQYNGFQIGMFISKPWLPSQNFRIDLLPFYSLKSNSLSGQSKLSYIWYVADQSIHSIELGLNLKTYAYNELLGNTLAYYQLSPYLKFDFSHEAYLNRTSNIQWTSYFIKDEYLRFDDSLTNHGTVSDFWRSAHKLNYQYNQFSILGNSELALHLNFYKHGLVYGGTQSLVNLEMQFLKEFRYSNKRYFSSRMYVSCYPYNSERHSDAISSRSKSTSYVGSTGLAFQNYLDGENEALFLGRSADHGLSSQQIFIRQGGFKLNHGASQRDNIGNSNRFIASLNLTTDLPIPKIGSFIKPYLDLGYYDQKQIESKNRIIYSGGIQLNLLYDRFCIYFPLVNSAYINTLYNSVENNSYWNRVSFSINLQIPEFRELLKHIQI